ncbi:MAG: XRE family transcriptional regulator [Oscillospiraceae bacterium]|nr:XRE family transcriptional regulator [Oscillospiraceae bacterium]
MDFRKTVKYRLIDLGKSQKWLEDQVREKTGLYVDSSYLGKIYSGERNAPKVRAAICEILNVKME